MNVRDRNQLAVTHLSLADGLAFKHACATGTEHDETRGIARLTLVEATRRFDPDRGVPFSAYAVKRIRGAMHDEHRRRCRQVVATRDLPVDLRSSAPLPHAMVEAECLRDAVDRLPARERSALRMRYWQDMGLREIGDTFGVSEGRACQIIRRGLTMVRELGVA